MLGENKQNLNKQNCQDIIKQFIASSNEKIRCDEISSNKFICSNTLNQLCQLEEGDKKIFNQMSFHPEYFNFVNGEKNKKKFILLSHANL